MAESRRITAAQPDADRRATGTKRVDKRYATGPYSRALDRGAVDGLNGNTAEAKFIKSYEAMLTEHCGGNPTAVQRQLIVRASRLACHLELWDQRTIPQGGAITATGHNHYIAFSSSLTRTLTALGLAPAAQSADPMAALRAHVAARQAAGSEAA